MKISYYRIRSLKNIIEEVELKIGYEITDYEEQKNT